MKETGRYMNDHKFHKTGRVLDAEVSSKTKNFLRKIFSKKSDIIVGRQIKDVKNIQNDVAEIIEIFKKHKAGQIRDNINKALFR